MAVKYKLKITECTSYSEMSQQAAQYFIKQLGRKPSSVIGLATGSTPIGLYKELIALEKDEKLSFEEATTFNLDEYIGLPSSHPESYCSYMHRHLFDHISLLPENHHLPDGMASDLELEARKYEEDIEAAGGIDLQILGLGSNGHIGFNEPGTSFSSQTHIVGLSTATREANARFFPSIYEVPTHAITMGIDTIMKAKKIVLLIYGQDKKEAYSRFLYGGVDESFPASILRLHPNVSVYYCDCD